jgi:hypothetical protein
MQHGFSDSAFSVEGRSRLLIFKHAKPIFNEQSRDDSLRFGFFDSLTKEQGHD